MPRIICSTLLFITVNLLFSQEKKTYYFEENSNPLTKTEFLKINNGPNYFFQTFDIDTAYVSISFRKKNYGTLSKVEFENLKSYLSKITISSSVNSDLLLIHYYPGPTTCSNSIYPTLWNTDDTNYLKQINKIATTSVNFIYINNDLLNDRFSDKFEWFMDKEQLIEKQFFKYMFPCGSFVVISKTGEFISYYGEYSKQTVLNFVKEISQK